jgi:L-2-hydroxyglutarate oxidase LhgO
LKRRRPRSRVTLLEKEAACGLHASGRNSGVLHAGFYYTADSLKAKFTREGNRRMTEYCVERGLGIRRCGKLVVARNEADLTGLDELYRRGCANGVTLEQISAEDAREIEPRAKTFERALFSASTSSVDPTEVLTSLVRDAGAAGISIVTGTAYLGHNADRVQTSAGPITAGYVVNAAGLYADRIARQYGFSERYEILPFKGLYLKADSRSAPFRTHIYPVPDLGRPFLDVHVTLTANGAVKIGPTATPAFWREHYGGLKNFKLAESASIVTREARLFLGNDFGFRDHALSELKKYRRRHLVEAAAALATGLRREDFMQWGPPGIRAQLLDVKARKLEMDFKFEGDDRSFHVLNAVSPAFTCSLPFSEYLVDQMEQLA